MTEIKFTADKKSAVRSSVIVRSRSKTSDSTNKNSAKKLKATEVADGEFS